MPYSTLNSHRVRFLFGLFLFGFTVLSYAQSVTLEGRVTDSLQNPLSFANIIATPNDTLVSATYTISDDTGQYHLSLQKDTRYTVSVRFLGYQTKEIALVPDRDIVQNFALSEQADSLEEVIIELPVTVAGDTTTYAVDKFRTGEERKLKDVLKKLPGIEVTRDSEVFFKGKKVTDVLVEDKKFFNGKSKLAVENIPSDAIDKVQLMENYTDVSFLKSFSDSDAIALNVKLKEDKKRFVFGDIEAGLGNDSFYTAKSNLFYYSPKTSVNSILNSNRTGDKALTFSDYLDFQGGTDAIFSGDVDFKATDVSQFWEDDDFNFREQHFGAINLIETTKKSWQFSSYVILNATDIRTLQEDINSYTLFTEFRNSRSQKDHLFGIANLKVKYTGKGSDYLKLNTQLKGNQVHSLRNVAAFTPIQDNQIATTNDLESFTLNQTLEWHKTINSWYTVSVLGAFTRDQNTPQNRWEATDLFLNRLVPADSTQNLFRLVQDMDTRRTDAQGILKNYVVLHKNHHIYATLSHTYRQENFSTFSGQVLDDQTTLDFSDNGFGNDLGLDWNKSTLGVEYKARTGIFTFKPGVFVNRFQWLLSSERSAGPTENTQWIVTPNLSVDVAFTSSKKIEFDYSRKTSFADANQLSRQFYLRSYNSIYRGNMDLNNEIFHTLRLRYGAHSLYRGISWRGVISYTKQEQGYQNAVRFDGVGQFLSPLLLDNASEDLTFSGYFRKQVGSIKLNLRANLSNSRFKQFINSVLETNQSERYGLTLSALNTHEDFPTVEMGLRTQWNTFRSSSVDVQSVTYTPFAEVSYDFLDGFIYSFDYELVNFQNDDFGQNNTYQIANTSLRYQKKEQPWVFGLSVRNFFNTEFKQDTSFSNYLISDSKTFVLPRIFQFSVGLSF